MSAEETLNSYFGKIIFLNEVGKGGDPLKLEDPDGKRSGKSGMSFGDCQFDVKNNKTALLCLKECAFTDKEIRSLVDETYTPDSIGVMNAKLKANAEVVQRYSNAQLKYCLDKAGQFAEHYGVPVSDSAGFLMLADTVNQYGSLGDGSAKYLTGLERPVTAQDVLDLKLEWKYSGTKHGHDDTVRRFHNVMKVINANT